MRSYILKRVLLMIPTLFGITLIMWLVVTAAPGDPGQAAFGEASSTKGGTTSESRRLFRAQFNLDKPSFWNDYVDLEPREVYDAVRLSAPTNPPKQRRIALERLDDWAYFAVPGLVASLDLAKDPTEKAAILNRLAINAKRQPTAGVRGKLSEDDKRLNREILQETREIEDALVLDLPANLPADETARKIEERAAAWKAWYAARKARWEWSAGEKLKIRLLDTRFAKYWGNLLRGDLGESHVHREPVFSLIVKRLPISITLSLVSILLAYALAVPIGVWAAVRHGTTPERSVTTVLFMLYSLPAFFVATLLFAYFGIGKPWRLIPVQGFESPDTFSMTTMEHILDVLHHVAAPLFCLTYGALAYLSRYAKSGILNVIRSDYVRTARAKGVEEKWVILKHTVRNGIIPIITLLGGTLPAIVGGSIIVERVFGIPGIGYLFWDSISQRDYNVVIGETVIVAILTMVGILVSDILYAIVDPRIRY